MKSPRKSCTASFSTIIPGLALGLLAFGNGCAGTPGAPEEHIATVAEGLNEDQCMFFDVDGKITICHHTSSATHPYTVIKISDQGCINGHAAHAQDFVATNDPTCSGGGCLPEGAPCDPTLPCCSGECSGGTCTSVCQNFTGTGCYWQENFSGNFCWVPSPSGFPDTIPDCKALDSCSANGGGLSGGGCYRWTDCSLCATIFPNPLWP